MPIIPEGLSIHGYLSCCNIKRSWCIITSNHTFTENKGTPALYGSCTVYPKKYAHGFVVLCCVVVMLSFIMNSHEVFVHIHQGCYAGTGAIVRLPQCQWSKPDGYGKISQCITTTTHSKAKTVCIFLGVYCTCTVCVGVFVVLRACGLCMNMQSISDFLCSINKVSFVNHNTDLRTLTLLFWTSIRLN